MAAWPYYTAAWARLRAAKLAEKPLCEPCGAQGRLTPASVVDHRVPITLGGPAFPSLDGLASMCPSCHSVKTNRDDRPRMAPKGCDASGLPVDPNHPFYASEGGGPSITSGGVGDRRGEVKSRVSSSRRRR